MPTRPVARACVGEARRRRGGRPPERSAFRGGAGLRCRSATASQICDKQNQCAGEGARRNQRAVARSDENAHQVRNDQTDEEDDAGEGNTRRDQESDDQYRELAKPFDVDAQMTGRVFTERQQVQTWGRSSWSRRSRRRSSAPRSGLRSRKRR